MRYDLTEPILLRLLLAALLGGLVGLERELRRKAAGLRTHMFICLGSALFTILSDELARGSGANEHTRIASQLIPGIGFLGAGAIIREGGMVTGLTTAATIFVVASMGMAVGGGLYWTSVFVCLLVLVLLVLVGWAEGWLSLKTRLTIFRITTPELEAALAAANEVLAQVKAQMQRFQVFRVGPDFIMEFDADVSHSQQKAILSRLKTVGRRCEVVPREVPAGIPL